MATGVPVMFRCWQESFVLVRMTIKSMAGVSKNRVFVVDDEPVVRRGLQLLLGHEPSLAVCGEAEGESEALEKILSLKPELAIVDLGLKEGSGINLLKDLRRHCPAMKILVFTMHNEAHMAAAAFAAGANGYVTKDEGTETVLEAIGLILHGGIFVSRQIATKAPGLGDLARQAGTLRPE